MSISEHNLTIIIVTIKSDKIIDQCIKSINKKDIPIIVVENSDDIKFKSYIEARYKNVKCILSNKNLGMGSGNNIGIKAANTDYVFIINPDVVLESDTINELMFASKTLSDFSILSPISSNSDIPNYGFFRGKKVINEKEKPFEVNWVDGCTMLLNKKKLKESVYFDENFFMYLENSDLCKRTINNGGKVFIVPKAKMSHHGAKTIDEKYTYEIELSRNWHWIWSKFYFNKKHYGILKAFSNGILKFITSMLKFLFFLTINNKIKKNIYYNRASGFYNSLIGKSAWYRPNLKE